MIQIDDAGSGSLIGGTFIGVMREETDEVYFDIIPIKLYNDNYFKKKLYLSYTSKIVDEAFKILKPEKNELIKVCQGYMFDDTRKKLSENNYLFINTKIEDPLQSIIEKSFEEYIICLGLPREFIKFTRYPFHFHRLLRWVYADYNNRIKLCKTGWKSFQKYGRLKTNTHFDVLYNNNYYCLKCGKRILEASPVKVITYTSNMPNVIYLHKFCP